jgi:hypothetical protein
VIGDGEVACRDRRIGQGGAAEGAGNFEIADGDGGCAGRSLGGRFMGSVVGIMGVVLREGGGRREESEGRKGNENVLHLSLSREMARMGGQSGK